MKLMSRRTVLFCFLGLLFAAPGVLALFFFRHPDMIAGAPTNQGFLLRPPVSVPALLEMPANWHLLLWNEGACETACKAALDRLARVRLALGRRARRVDVSLVTSAPASLADAMLVKTLKDADIRVLGLDDKAFAGLPQNVSAFFIADPEGYLVLSYAKDAPPGALYHDLKHLLETNPDG
ncbi:hypothetical protein Lgee_1401 [Legionella geestiana]|uniref:Uncharacterized protein n=1 Tax=Legionella geestiana TaxID=45065 RepID=A0A0W0TU62_9GAMM|nr:hypothetical protein [Legionella geestiana]KTC98955.1 hypothetical protein Lgee_1401 [Legionella geestiana]QBS13044.1 hypothetical protein E4T54_10020 [Legionella geestiana]QDQ39276.1 hypothetical protein E3226_002050 [Legionella geestiana]STX54443.1 Uncharacterised protein [Legionella geestiana]